MIEPAALQLTVTALD